jgi:hypothetical protein
LLLLDVLGPRPADVLLLDDLEPGPAWVLLVDVQWPAGELLVDVGEMATATLVVGDGRRSGPVGEHLAEVLWLP